MSCAAKGHSFIPPYQAGIDFSLITEEHKKLQGLFEQQAKCGTTDGEGAAAMTNTKTKQNSEIFA